MAVLWGTYDFMGTNPASVNMLTGDILLNMDVFPHLNPFTQRFIIEHEKAHFNQQTDSEYLADKTALNRLYKTENQSLKKSVRALADFLSDDNDRVETIYYEALKIDKSMRNRNLYRNRTHPFPDFFLSADGDESSAVEESVTNTGVTTRKGRSGWSDGSKRFITLFGYVFSVGDLAVAILLLMVFIRLGKK